MPSAAELYSRYSNEWSRTLPAREQDALHLHLFACLDLWNYFWIFGCQWCDASEFAFQCQLLVWDVVLNFPQAGVSQRSIRLSFGVGFNSQCHLRGVERRILRGEVALRAARPQVLPLWTAELFDGKLWNICEVQTNVVMCYIATCEMWVGVSTIWLCTFGLNIFTDIRIDSWSWALTGTRFSRKDHYNWSHEGSWRSKSSWTCDCARPLSFDWGTRRLIRSSRRLINE